MNLKDIPICDFMPFNLNRYIDILYTQYHINEAQGISEKLLPIAENLSNIIDPYMGNVSKDTFVYTGYNWNFDKQEFIKLDDKSKPYPLWIKIFVNSNNQKDSYTFRQINKEKEGKTAMCICIYTHCENTESILLHELQHMREMYALPYKNVVEIDTTNIYGLHKDDMVFTLFHSVFYMLSSALQHACLQQVYHYVYNNDDYKEINIDEYNVKKLSKIDVLEAGIKVVNGYMKKEYYDIDIVLDSLFDLGLILKRNFKWKYPKLNKSYIEEVKNHKRFDQSIVFVDMVKYIIALQQKYQRKVYRAIYKAIQDRKEKSK